MRLKCTQMEVCILTPPATNQILKGSSSEKTKNAQPLRRVNSREKKLLWIRWGLTPAYSTLIPIFLTDFSRMFRWSSLNLREPSPHSIYSVGLFNVQMLNVIWYCHCIFKYTYIYVSFSFAKLLVYPLCHILRQRRFLFWYMYVSLTYKCINGASLSIYLSIHLSTFMYIYIIRILILLLLVIQLLICIYSPNRFIL